MKIAFIGHKRIPSNAGGVEKVVEQQAVRMAERGHKVTAYNRGGHNVFGKEFDNKKLKEYKGVRIVTVPTTKGSSSVPIYSFFATLRAIFKRYDCISYNASGSCAMIPLAKLFRLRTVALLHGIDSQRDKWGGFASKYLSFGEKQAAKRADVCLVLSENMKQYIKDTFGTEAITFVLSTRYEGFPNVLREAMYAGLPCISSDCEFGPSELIDDGKNGYLFPIGDADALYEKLTDLMSDENKRDKMGKLAKESVEFIESSKIYAQWNELILNEGK